MSDTTEVMERRLRPAPHTAEALLGALPARVVLDRMSTPAVGVDVDGRLSYANQAFTTMLGYPEVAAVQRLTLPDLLVDSARPSHENLRDVLRGAGKSIVDWLHAEGYSVRTMVSGSLLLRATDPLQVFTITDITEVLWAEAPVVRSRQT